MIPSTCAKFALAASALLVATTSPAVSTENVTVVDIRTPGEWRQTGVIDGALLLTFFDEQGGYDARGFVERLLGEVDPESPVLLVCRTGSRTTAVTNFLRQIGFSQIDHVEGGMLRLLAEGVTPVVPADDAFTPSTRFGSLWRCAADGDARAARCSAEP
ncbi:MAG: rhodanese-like domain-containing protein [Geminicoccaceae bacterium]|nr:MAG: rhodanese-like domain-containing protein [Geminicoccaceae bacterium]